MTATLDPARPAAPPTPRRRWHRVLVPIGLAVLLIVATLVLHAVDQPDPDDPGFLAPAAAGDDGGSRLAEALRGQGVPIRRETDTLDALRAAGAVPTTLFVPAPDLVHPDTLAALTVLPPGSRLVLVEPSRRVLTGVGLPLEPTDRRWATRAVPPDADGGPCRLPEALRAGTAAVDHQRYAGPYGADRCYAGALRRISWGTEVVVIGASDPFRNDRIDEWGNRALATGLLGGDRPLVWLDLPGPAPAPTGPGWSPSPDDDGTPLPRDTGGRDNRADPPPSWHNPLWDAFPPWFWAILAQLAVAGLLLVLWRARRLGPPVPEPLPVTVRAAETVLGRARLYRRAGARDTTAATLRTAALDRLLPRLNLPPDTPPDEVAARVAAHAGADPERVAELLHGAAPENDRELLELARDLDALTRTLAPHPTEGDPR
ncbi:DUF4350 domain-containing protein [Micromonospora sp. MA102]|uniref:DUF4350 domain-containing protein n=1 Tax=Micromonospora sp. MA102 TaxID=2952755 RepID=UPI0021CA1FB1|nr:DUF4350 domain-containing protein [Micromonospora sp. MA102]